MDSDIENDPRAHSTPKRDESSAGDDQMITSQTSDRPGHRRDASGQLGVEQAGESTRSLLSVLSHSSVQNSPEASYSSGSSSSSRSSSSKLTPRKRRSKSPPSSSVSHSKSSMQSSQSTSRNRSASAATSQSESRHHTSSSMSGQFKQRSRSASSATSQSSSRTAPVRIASSSSSRTATESPSEPQLTPWEKWLVRKTEQERKSARLQVRREREELRKKNEAEMEKKEKETIIKARVNEWIQEKTVEEKTRRKRREKREQRKKDQKDEEQQQMFEKAKTNREQWLSDKKTKEQEQKLKEDEDKAKSAEKEQERRAKAKDAYDRWRQEASKKPKPIPSSFGVSKGTLKGYYDTAAYPIPNFYNPIPWMPIQVPKPTEVRDKQGTGSGPRRGQKVKSAKRNPDNVQQLLSPPLLYKDRQTEAKFTRWGRPR